VILRGADLRHIVVVVPGIGGSALRTAEGRLVWGGSLTGFVARALVPDALHLEANPTLASDGALSVAAELPGLSNVHPYDALVRRLRRAFPGASLDPGAADPDRRVGDAGIVVFTYDFRRSIVEAAERMREDIDRRLAARPRDTRVIVVGHSMGGLIARYWLGPLGGWRVCDALLTLGTPHRGAPKALEWLANGVRVGPLRLDAATEVVRSWPSVYELLPRYRAVDDGGAARYPYELPPALLRTDLAEAAFAVHGQIEGAWADMPSRAAGGPRVVALFGHGHGTLQGHRLAGGRLMALREEQDWIDTRGLLGDGTVPAVSAVPIELSDDQDRWRQVGGRHGALSDADGVVDFVRNVAAPSTRSLRGRRGDVRPTVGVDLDSAIVAGTRVEAPLRVTGVAGPVTGWVVVLGPDVAGAAAVVGDGTGWRLSIGPLPPGRYALEVAARTDDDPPPPMREVLTVVDP
jgi:hypothetical protein